jgi:hypothetical protein
VPQSHGGRHSPFFPLRHTDPSTTGSSTGMQSQSQRPPHHANASRSLFQNPWTLAETTLGTSTSTYWPAGLNLSTIFTFVTNPGVSLARVRNSEIHPHPPVKVVKPDWGYSTSTSAAASSEPNIRATWLGHAVRSQPTRCSSTRRDALSRVSSSSFRVLQLAQMKSRLACCSTPSSQTSSALCHG